MYLSPELLEKVVSVHVDATLFSDHSVLYAVLKDSGVPERLPTWRIPKPLPWTPQLVEAVKSCDTPVEVNGLHPTHAYRELCQTFEADFREQCKTCQTSEVSQANFGRGQTLHRTFKPREPAPVKPSRAGERIPGFHGTNLDYKRCFKQLRRLVNYHRLVSHELQTASQKAHQIALWSAIVHSPSFDQPFRSWWKTQAPSWPGSPAELPSGPPDQCVAEVLVQALQAHVDRLETRLRTKAINHAKEVRQADTNAIFRDIRKAKSQPVDTLVTQISTEVMEVDQSENAIIVDPVPDFLNGQPIFSSVGLLEVTHWEEDKLWLANPKIPTVGDKIHQQLLHGTIQEIQNKFIAEWKARWQQHADKPEEDWLPLLAIVDEALPATIPSMHMKQLDGPLIRKFVASKKSTAATGMDGVSRQDLLAMSGKCLNALGVIFSKAESTGRWPSQMLHGAVSALQKHETASQVHEYRPITIYSMAYRVWSSCRSREVLQHMSQYAPAGVKGNRAHVSSVEMWWKLQQTVEYHLFQDEPLTGAILDVIKAFNHLPRPPIFRAASHLGIPGQLLQAWWGFLCTMERHFIVRQIHSAGIISDTGLAEGCGLSVCGMFIFDWILDQRLCQLCPTVPMTSYVDNFALQTENADALLEAVTVVNESVEQFGMQIDSHKTRVWATVSSFRATLRDHGQVLQQAGRDLGGHMQFDHRCTNSSVTSKMQDLAPMWSKLSRSLANTQQKLKAARQSAWPRAFHSGSIVHLGWHRVHKQRVQLMKAIGYSQPSASSLIQFGLSMQPKNDPGFWLLAQSLRHFRKFADEHMSQWILEVAAQRPTHHEPGPCGVLLSRLQDVQWQHVQKTVFRDQHGSLLDISQMPVQELDIRLRDAWWLMIAQQAAKRKDFAGIQNVDVALSFSNWKSHPPDAQGYLRVLMNGSQICANRHYADAETCQCKFCGEQDSVKHRHWECEGTAESRKQLRPDTLSRISELPPCTTLHGWAIMSAHLQSFRSQLVAIPQTTHLFAFPPEMWRHSLGCDLFPDGSADHPRCPTTRIASWAVCIAHWEDPEQYVQLSAGIVPGLCQTVLRAEISAMISCLTFLSEMPCGGRVWTDNATVLDRTNAILQGVFQIQANTPDGDLWRQVAALAPVVRDKVVIAKVYSHIDSSTLSAAEQWVVRGNSAADQAAQLAHEHAEPSLLREAAQLREAQQKEKTLINDLHAHFVRVARQFVESPAVSVDPEKLQEAPQLGPELPLKSWHST